MSVLRVAPKFNQKIPNYEIYGVIHSCDEIGGDYYDFMEKENGKTAIVIAEVSGKGAGIALVRTDFQASILSLSRENINPDVLIAKLNRAIMAGHSNQYITVFYAELDWIKHTFEYVNAGHNPPLLLIQNGYTRLSACGPVVGVVPDAQYQSDRINLEPKDLVFFYTNGITDIRNPQEEPFGEARVLNFLMNNRNAGLEELSGLLENKIHDFVKGAPPLDDRTLVILKRLC